jgi:hypothetical protein
MIRSFAFLLLFLMALPLLAQEFDCQITLNDESLTAEARENLSDFVQQLKDYVNSHKWTDENFGEDKIKCSIEIFIQGAPRDNHYVAQAFIGSQRPINRMNQNSGVLRLKDDKWEFDYIRFQPLMHDDYRFDPLLSFIDFYMYLILGSDYDTFDKAGDKGTKYLQKAFEIANKGRSAGAASTGWEPSTQTTYSRSTYVEELLNPRMRELREAIYRYHYRGLDYLNSKPDKAKQSVFAAIESIGNLQSKINQRSLTIKVFFDTKYMEIADLFLDFSDPLVYSKIVRVDPAHQSTYEEYERKRR